MQDYWEGDAIRLRSTGELGEFGSVKDRYTAYVFVEGISRIVPRSDVILVEEEPKGKLQKHSNQSSPQKSESISKTPTEIDLHMEVLDPRGQIHQNRMLDYQMSVAKAYVDSAIASKAKTIKIIHGKGKGILKETLLLYLKDHEGVRYCIDANTGGATEVWLK